MGIDLSRATVAGWALVLLCAIPVAFVSGCKVERSETPPAEVADAGGRADKGNVGSEDRDDDPPRIAFVTNQIADFWNIAKAGCQDAQKDFNIVVDVQMPSEAEVTEQKRIVNDLVASGIDGIAISPLDPVNQKEWLNGIAAKVPLITHDSDAAGTDRLMFIGMDNYEAGQQLGKLVQQALPDGGEVMLFVGRLEQTNAKDRRQGAIDVLLGRESQPDNYDPVEGVLRGEKYTILGTQLDQGKQERCKEKAADSLNAHPEMDAMVCLFEYNPPACYQALKQAGKLGQIQLVGFDENELTLQAIKDGDCIGTVVQNPFMYGYESMRVLNALLKGDTSVVPESKIIYIPARTITKENVDKFWEDLKAQKSG